jgi:hypothetical protein
MSCLATSRLALEGEDDAGRSVELGSSPGKTPRLYREGGVLTRILRRFTVYQTKWRSTAPGRFPFSGGVEKNARMESIIHNAERGLHPSLVILTAFAPDFTPAVTVPFHE